MSTAERAVVCGLCQAPLPEAVLQAGGAKAIRGAVYCGACAALYQQALGETLAWRTALTGGTSLACARCGMAVPVDDVREEAVIFFQGRLACRRCAKDLRGVLLARKVSAPAAGQGSEAPFARIRAEPEKRGAGLGVALVAGAILLAGGAVGYAVAHRAPVAAPVSPEAIAAEKARAAADRAFALATRTPETFEKACEVLKEVSQLAAEHGGHVEAEGKLQTAIQRATRARDGFAPAIASKLIELAAAELKKTDHPEEALAVLDRFPKELQGTVAAGEIGNARAGFEALLTCRRTALQLLSLGGAEGFSDMDALMTSPEALACGFAQTDLGQRVSVERRRRRNAAAVNAATVPVTPSDSRSAAWSELKFDLVEAEAQYAAMARKNPERPDAHLGLARIYFERDRLDLAQPYAEQGVRLAPNRADALQIQGWLEWLSPAKDAWDRTAMTIGKLPYDWFNRHGRRLRWLLDLGKPLHQGTHVRVLGRGVTADATLETAAEADAAAAVAVQALGVGGGQRLDLLLFGDDGEKKKFLDHLELRKVTHEGVLLGCFAVTPNGRDLNAVRLAVAAGIARRAPGAAPDWLVAALPYSVSARPAPGPLRMKLSELERLDMNGVLTRADAWATAIELASLCYTEDGREALAAYISARKEGASPRAREALEKAHARAR